MLTKHGCACTPCSCLDPKQVVEQHRDEVVVEVLAPALDHEDEDRQPRQTHIPQDYQVGHLFKAREYPITNSSVALSYVWDSDRIFELEGKPCFNLPYDGRSPCLLPLFYIQKELMLFLIHKENSSAAWSLRGPT